MSEILLTINKLLYLSIEYKASDLHLSAELPPILRIDGELKKLDLPKLENKILLDMILNTMTESQRDLFQEEKECDYAFSLENNIRFRVNVFYQQRGVSAVFRCLPTKMVLLNDLNVPDSVYQMCEYSQGLVMVTGPTGSGKSTTLAAMLNHINHTQHKHIITLEDPIEIIHHSELSLIQQREIKRDTKNFSNALKMALREDPDIILVGEMRDIETIRLALIAAETGHLVLSTLHTQSAAKTIDRVIQVFPAAEQEFIRHVFSHTLRGVISQRLIKKKTGGRMAAYEILLNTASVSHLIRENKIAQIYSVMQMQQAAGMRTMEQSLSQINEIVV